MKSYKDLLTHILDTGVPHADRTGVGTLSTFGYLWQHDMATGFPLLTTKKVHVKSVLLELLWFLRGETNVKSLEKDGVTIWSAWQREGGALGPIYGSQWRRWGAVEAVVENTRPRPEIVLDSDKVAGVGVCGASRAGNEKLYSIWSEMLHRCYNPDRSGYKHYGGRGIFVDTRWHLFDNFVTDVRTLRDWNMKQVFWDSYELDKDYLCSNYYGPDSCVWLNQKEQCINQDRGIGAIVATSPEGRDVVTMDITGFAHDTALDVSTIYKCLRGDRRETRGWTFRKLPQPEGMKYRYRQVDQIQRLIADLTLTPESRRMLVTAWNVTALDRMALPPCHVQWQVKVDGGRLHLKMDQRSADAFLGVPFNIASYAFLLEMLAQVCGYKPGKLIITFGDLHIYNNHRAQVEEQLSRECRPLPVVNLNPAVREIDQFKFEDFTLLGYDPHPAIKGDVAV